MTQTSSNKFSIRIVPIPTQVAAFSLTSAIGGVGLPFTMGHAFKKGQVPAGAQLAGNIPLIQIVGKNWWPDGSLKFAVISGRADLTAGVERTINLGIGSAIGGVNLTTSNLRSTGVSASTGATGYGVVSWSGADWDAPFRSWTSGPQMSSWIYRKPIGSDLHLVAWLEVRLFAGGAVEILPWVENGYLTVAGPQNKNADYTFMLDGAERFRATIDLPHHSRTVLISGSRFSYWHGTDPQIVPQHDKAYLQATKLVPAYCGAISSTASIWTRLTTTYSPLQQSNYSNAMGQPGYFPAIGLIPEWDVAYLTSRDARAYASVIANAYSAGRYGIHYRDEKTQQPPRFSSYPNLVINAPGSGIDGTGASTKDSYTPQASGTLPPTWDTPHHPSIGYMAYLLTGRFYFMEEVQFSATVNFLKCTDFMRMFSSGVLQTTTGANTTRGAAWAIRTLAQAACVTPDSDTALRTELTASMAANVEFYHSTYVAQPNNKFGIVAPYSSYTTGIYSEAAWMQDFFTAATGYAIDLEIAMPATSTAKLASFFAWKAQSIIGRLGGTAATDFLFCDAAQYTLAVAPTDQANFLNGTGPFYANWGEIYAATLKTPNPGQGTLLAGAYFPEATSYWGMLQPAIAYAVQNKVDGAAAAYARMRGAPNWYQIVAGWNEDPVWGVIPHAA